MKIKASDTWFSKCVRERADYRCERCHKQSDIDNTNGQMQCSHIFSRRHRTIRWDGMNAQCLCPSCHRWFGENPYESGKWLDNVFGAGYMRLLTDKKNAKIKVPKSEEKEIAAHYRKEFNRMRDLRTDRNVGWIDFESYQ